MKSLFAGLFVTGVLFIGQVDAQQATVSGTVAGVSTIAQPGARVSGLQELRYRALNCAAITLKNGRTFNTVLVDRAGMSEAHLSRILSMLTTPGSYVILSGVIRTGPSQYRFRAWGSSIRVLRNGAQANRCQVFSLELRPLNDRTLIGSALVRVGNHYSSIALTKRVGMDADTRASAQVSMLMNSNACLFWNWGTYSKSLTSDSDLFVYLK